MPTLHQSQGLLEKLGLLGSHSSVPRQSPKSKGSSWPGADDTTSADDTTVAKAVERNASTASKLAVFSGEARSARPGEKDTTNAQVAAVARPAGEVRPLGTAKHNHDRIRYLSVLW